MNKTDLSIPEQLAQFAFKSESGELYAKILPANPGSKTVSIELDSGITYKFAEMKKHPAENGGELFIDANGKGIRIEAKAVEPTPKTSKNGRSSTYVPMKRY